MNNSMNKHHAILILNAWEYRLTQDDFFELADAMEPAERDRVLFHFFAFCTPSTYDKDEAVAFPDTKMIDLVSAVNYRIFRQYFEANENDLSLLAQLVRYLAFAWQLQDREHDKMTSAPFLQKVIDDYKAGNPLVQKHMYETALKAIEEKEDNLERNEKEYNEFW